MKLSKLLAGFVAAATTVTALTAAVSAYDFKDDFGQPGVNLGKNWSINAQVPASEFADLTADSYVTVTFDADQAEEEYWSIKPMNGSWEFIDPNGEGGPELAEGKDAYPVEKDQTSISFKVPADYIDSVKEGGMVFIGHSITLKTLTVSNEAPAPEETTSDNDKTDENNNDANTSDDANNNNTDNNDKDTPNTGIEGVAVLMGFGTLAGVAVLISKKKK